MIKYTANQHRRLPRQSASFLWCLGLHCVVKMISRDPACHSSNNKSNKHCKRLFFPFILGCRLYDSEQSCGTDSGCIQSYCMIQTTHLWQSMTGYCLFFLFVSPSQYLSLCFVLVFFVSVSCFVLFAMPEIFLGTRQHGGERCARMALHCSIQCSRDVFLELLGKKKEGDSGLFFFPEGTAKYEATCN